MNMTCLEGAPPPEIALHTSGAISATISKDANLVARPVPSGSTYGPPQSNSSTDNDAANNFGHGKMFIKDDRSPSSERPVPDDADISKTSEMQPQDAREHSRKRKSEHFAPAKEDADDESPECRTRFRWTDELHQYFLACIFELGLEIANPEKVFRKMMAEKQLGRTIVEEELVSLERGDNFGKHYAKSHLQQLHKCSVPIRQAFVRQLKELMQESKRYKKLDVKSKVLNPEYHAYPFAADRVFPDYTSHPKVASLLTGVTIKLRRTRSLSKHIPTTTGEKNHHHPSIAWSPSSASAVTTNIPSRPRAVSSIDPSERMEAQIEMQNGFENPFQGQTVQIQPSQSQFVMVQMPGYNIIQEAPMQPGVMYPMQPMTTYVPVTIHHHPSMPSSIIGYPIL